MQNALPPSLDAQAAERWLQRPVAQAPWLHEEVGRRMAERLTWIKLHPEKWLHWAPSLGGLQTHALVAAQYPKSQAFMADASESRSLIAIEKVAKPWWNPSTWTGGRVHAGMPEDAAVQMVWANMALHIAPDPQALIAQWHRALAPQGFLMFSCLGPDTVRELRAVYAALGWPPPSHDYTDMHDWGDMLVQAGYAEPIMDMERITLGFATPQRLLQELRGLGRNFHRLRFAGLRGRGWQTELHAALGQHLAEPGTRGELQLTFEVIYGHAIKPQPRVKVSAHSAVSLQDMRSMLHAGRG